MVGDKPPEFPLMPLEGQITFSAVAVLMTMWPALELFKWRSNEPDGTSYYKKGADTWPGKTNWWELANTIGFYGGLVLWGAAAVTQLATLGGALADINVMVWGYGLGMVGALVELVASLIHEYGKWSAFSLKRDNTQTPQVRGAASDVFNSMEWEEIEYAAVGAMVGVELAAQYNNWMAAQWMALPEETRKEWEKAYEDAGKEEQPDEMMTLLDF